MMNLEKVKAEYIKSGLSLRKLAEKYKIPLSTLSRRCKKENWVAEREHFKRKTLTKFEEKEAGREADRMVRLQTAAEKMLAQVEEALEDEKQFRRHLVQSTEQYTEPQGPKGLILKSTTKERLFGKRDTKAMRELTATLKELTGVMRDFYDVPTPGEAEARRIAAERLELERAKIKESDGPEEIRIIMEGAEDYAG